MRRAGGRLRLSSHSRRVGSGQLGQVAKRQAITNPENTVYSIKRFMGRRLNEVGDEMKMVPYKVVAKGDNVAVIAQGKGAHGAGGFGDDPARS